MKTLVFMQLLKLLASNVLPAAEFKAFENAFQSMRWNQYRQHFPELWDRFSEKFNAIKDQITASSDPQDVAQIIAPGNIEHYPELFEPFRLQIEQIRSNLTSDVDLVSATSGASDADTAAISDAVNSIQMSPPSAEVLSDGGDGSLLEWVGDFLGGLFG